MAIYVLLMIALMVAAMANIQFDIRPRANGVAWAAVTFLLIVFVGFRDGVGTDQFGYQALLRLAEKTSFLANATGPDPLFMVIAKIVTLMGLKIWALNLVAAIIFLSGVIHFIRRQPQPWLGLAIAFPYLIVVFGMSALRQACALGVILYALRDFEEGRLRRFVVLMLVAALFHVTSLIVLGVAIASLARNRWFTLAIIVILAIPANFLLDTSVSKLLGRVSTYKDSGGAIFRLMMNVLPALLFLTISKIRRQERPSSLPLWRNFALLAVVSLLVLAVGDNVSTAADRLNIFLIPLQIYVLTRMPGALTSTRVGARMLILSIATLYLIVMLVYFSFGSFADAYIPYRNVLFL